MKQYCCPKCGSIDVFLKDSGSQKGLYCSEGCGWIKWIGNKELPLVEKFIKDNEISISKPINTDGIMSLKGYIEQKKWELEIENNAYNRGVVKGLEVALKIMEDK